MKKLSLIIALFLSVGIYAQYVDLGLPSGNLWKTVNEDGYYDFPTANATFQDALPCYGDWKELTEKCKWEWTGDGYNIIGPNGNRMYLPAAGGQACNGDWYDPGLIGNYWTSSHGENGFGWQFTMLADNDMSVGLDFTYNHSSVRLIRTR